jgi:hypothetical protein
MKTQSSVSLKTGPRHPAIFPCLIACLALALAPGGTRAATFDDNSPPNVETTFSIGVFKIIVEPTFAPMFVGYPGWRPSTRTLTSPVMYDGNTQIGISPSHVNGDAPSVAGLPVGVGPSRTVALGDYSVSPYQVPAAFQAPGAVREVFDELRLMRLAVSGSGAVEECTNRVASTGSPAQGVPPAPAYPSGSVLVSAGGLTPPGPACLGMVQSLVPGGAPAVDFPARSFFDIFAEVNLPAMVGWPGGFLRNTSPLIVENPALTEFPPRATYVHGISTAVALYLRDPVGPNPAGTLFGYLTLAGHGVFTNCPTDAETQTFLDDVLGPTGNKPGAPIPQHTLTDRCPSPGGTYESPTEFPPTVFPPGILVRNFRHSQLNNPIVPPVLGSGATYQSVGTRLDAEVSQDGGNTWQPFTAFGNTVVSIQHVSDSGGTRSFDTEMLALDMSGGSLPAGVMLRESPTRASLGKHTISPAQHGGFNVASFFDVFLELSVDGGANWSPAPDAARVELRVPAPVLAPYTAAILDCNPIAFYRFSEDIATPVLDTAANLGSLGAAGNGLYNNAIHPVAGALTGSTDQAVRVSGGQNVLVPFNAALNPAGAFSAEVWLRPAAANGAGVLTCPIASVHIASPRSGWLIYQSDTGWNWRTYNQNSTTVALSITGGGAPVVGNWYHVVVVWDGSVGTMYVNGVLAATSAATTFVANPDGAFAIGTRSGGDFVWAGDADEAAIYNVALTPAQIAAHYSSGTTGTPVYDTAVLADSPVGYWRLNEPTFVPPIALNNGSLGAVADGAYNGGALTGSQAPRPPTYVGMDAGNSALQLDGVNDFVSTLSGLLNSKPRFTVMGWLRRAGVQGGRNGLFGQNDIVEFGYINNTTLECWTDNGLDIPSAFPDNEWDHVAITQDGNPGTMTMYTNGAVAGSRFSTLPADNAFKFNIGGGGIFDTGGNFFNGQLDEVAVFDKALSAQKICDLYYTAVASAPRLTLDLPASTNLFEGGTITLCTIVCGTPPFTYRWYYFGSEIPGQTGPCLVITNAAEFDSGSYNVEISNAYGTISSGFCEVTVQPTQPPSIVQQPVSITRYVGGTAVFNVVATGGINLGYQWSHDGNPIPDATNATLTLSNVQLSHAGGYRVAVTNAAGSTPSDIATLTVLNPAPGSYERTILDCQPFAYWRLNETNGTVAYDYVGGNNGTYNNVTQGAPGGLAGDTDLAAEFNGTSSYVSTVSGLLNGRNTFTMLGWIRRAADQADRTGLFGQNDLVEFGYINNNTLECWTDNGLDISPNPLPNGQWGQVAVVHDGSPGTMTMYFNGSAIGSRASTLPGPNAFSFNIGGGGIFDAAGNFFNGRIDEVALFNTALPASKICALYMAGSGADPRINLTIGGNLTTDSKPSGTPHDGANFGAAWAAANTDGAPVTRTGVMQFVATEGDQITVPAHADFNSAQGTISFWMRSAGTAGGGNYGAILFDRRGGPGDVIVQQDTGEIFVQAHDGSAVVNQFATVATVNNDRWRHVAYVYNQSAGGSISIYIDGALAGSQANAAAWSWPAGQQIELGRSHDGYWRVFDGALDDVRIYDRMLNPAEVAQLAGTGALVDATALKLRLNFDAAPTGVTMTWACGTLQCTDALLGGGTNTVWTNVPAAVPPYVINPANPQRFYRISR